MSINFLDKNGQSLSLLRLPILEASCLHSPGREFLLMEEIISVQKKIISEQKSKTWRLVPVGVLEESKTDQLTEMSQFHDSEVWSA